MIASVDTTCRPTCLTVWVSDDNLDENKSQTSELSVSDENTNTVSKKRKNKSKEKIANKKV